MRYMADYAEDRGVRIALEIHEGPTRNGKLAAECAHGPGDYERCHKSRNRPRRELERCQRGDVVQPASGEHARGTIFDCSDRHQRHIDNDCQPDAGHRIRPPGRGRQQRWNKLSVERSGVGD